jgi:hypothetical protein
VVRFTGLDVSKYFARTKHWMKSRLSYFALVILHLMEFPLIGRKNLILSTFSSCGLFFVKLRFFVVHITFLEILDSCWGTRCCWLTKLSYSCCCDGMRTGTGSLRAHFLSPDDTWANVEQRLIVIYREPEGLAKEPDPLPLCSPQIPHGVPCSLSRASVVKCGTEQSDFSILVNTGR